MRPKPARHVRSLALVTSVAFGAGSAGCYSSTNVTVAELSRVRSGDHADGTVVYGEDGGPVKLDPNSELRFTRRDGSTTGWITVRDLSVNDDGVFLLRDAGPSDLHSALVLGLTREEISDFERSRPEGADWFARGEDGIELQGGAESLAPWIYAIERVRHGVPGKWLFHCSPDVGPFMSSDVLDAARKGVRVVDGLRWDDIQSAEVQNLNQGETAIAVVAVTAIAVGVVTIVVASKGKINLPSGTFSGPSRVASSVGRGLPRVPRALPRIHPHGGVRIDIPDRVDSSTSSEPTESSTPLPTEAPAVPVEDVSHEGVETYGLGASWLEQPRLDGARPLFDGGARRQSIIRLVASLDTERDLSSTPRTHVGVAATMRLYNFFELGGGLRMLGASQAPDGTVVASALLPFLRIGMHAELDAHRRFAIPFAVDLGGGGDIGLYMKLVFGLRVRVTDQWSLGAYVFNPTLLMYKDGSTMGGATQWSFPSGIETSFAF
ncbi:MAG: hypothetical protein ACHREM_27980 [Polyangiales bacterium]